MSLFARFAVPLLAAMTAACTTASVIDEEDAGNGAARQCIADNDCTNGGMCLAGKCATTCSTDAECPDGEGCNSGMCGVRTICTESAACPAGQVCVAGACQAGCDEHADCPASQHCENGSCLDGAHCESDAQCPPSMICAPAGVCVDGCRENANCTEGRACIANECADCSDHGQCGGGEVCDQGRCRAGCVANADCNGGQACVANTCSACISDTQCGLGFECRTGACVAVPPCTSDGQCPASAHCQDGYCTSNPGCGTNADCAPSQTCVDGTCARNDACASNADCSPSQTCQNGACTWNPACASSETCPATQSCVAGVCTTNPTCSSDAQCGETQRCVSGTCTRNDSCTQDDDCPGTQACLGGTCTRNPSCSVDTDCGPVHSCVGGTCTRNAGCSSELECSPMQSCTDGHCTRNPSCTDDRGCSSSQTCQSGICTDNNPCATHNDCPSAQYCLSGVCQQGPQCTADTDCPTTQRCQTGRCIANPACASDLQCPREQHCENGTCARNDTCPGNEQCPTGQACVDEQCVQARDCVQDSDCQDGTLCNGAERCDLGAGGVCVGGTPPTISDGVPCTEDVCDPATGNVTHTPRTSLCNDQNPCTFDSCDQVLGCQFDADPAATPPQTATGDCRREVCQSGNPASITDDTDVPINDGISCTVEECVSGVARRREDNAACSDGNACNGAERCVIGQGCRPPATGFACPPVDACSVGFCDPVTGCGSRPLDADNDGHLPTSCGGDDCNDMDGTVHTGHVEIPSDGRDNNCNGFIDEGFGTLSCPSAPGNPNPRILDPITLTATVSGATPGTFSVRWTVVTEPQANSLALQNAATPSVTFTPVVRGGYQLRARLTQTGAADQTCNVSFTVDGPDEDFNAQLIMKDGVDVDLHVLHPLGHALEQTGYDYFYEFNWGPANSFSCWDGLGWYTCGSLEAARQLPDCHWSNCTACTVTVPGQPACASTTLSWRTNQAGTLSEDDGTAHAYSYPFAAGGSALSVDANPKLDIDNRRGCYTDSLGVRVCTPENISIKHPGNAAPGRYTVAVHYYGEPVVQSGTEFLGNVRGVAPAGLSTVTVDVEVFCKGVGFRKYRCSNIPVDGWCFVADAVWSAPGSQCSAITTPTRTFAKRIRSDSDGLYWDTAGPNNVVGVLIQ